MYRLNEIGDTLKGQYALGQVYARANKRRSGITDAWIKQMPKKEYYTAAEYYPKGTEKYDDIMHDAKAEAECPTNRKVNMKPVVYNDKGYETTNFGLGMMDYEKSHKTNENNQYTNMNKKLIRLTESDLHRIVKGSVKRVLKEWDEKEEDILASLQNNKDRAEEGSLYSDLNKKRIYREICKFETALGALQVDENSEWYENLYSALSNAKAANRTRKEIEKDEYYQDPGWGDSPRRF